jgi:hypothetical protein
MLTSTSLVVKSQTVERVEYNFNSLVRNIDIKIDNNDGCDESLNEIEEISEDIKSLLKNKSSLSDEDLGSLIAISTKCKALENFIRTVGNTGRLGLFLSNKDLYVVKGLINFDIYELTNYKFCAKVYEIRIGTYKCLLVNKAGIKEIFRISVELSSKNKMSTMKSEFGTVANEYRAIINNTKEKNYENYTIKSMTCKDSNYSSMY